MKLFTRHRNRRNHKASLKKRFKKFIQGQNAPLKVIKKRI